jgi:hypothetical protein
MVFHKQQGNSMMMTKDMKKKESDMFGFAEN